MSELTERLAKLTDDIANEVGADGRATPRWWVAWATTAYQMVEDLKPTAVPSRPANLPGDWEIYQTLQTYRRKAAPSKQVKETAELFGEYVGAMGRIEALNAGSLHAIVTMIHVFDRTNGLDKYATALRAFVVKHYWGATVPLEGEHTAPALHDWCMRTCRRSEKLVDWLYYGRIPTEAERWTAKEECDE